jgi:hypothetical protein
VILETFVLQDVWRASLDLGLPNLVYERDSSTTSAEFQ